MLLERTWGPGPCKHRIRHIRYGGPVVFALVAIDGIINGPIIWAVGAAIASARAVTADPRCCCAWACQSAAFGAEPDERRGSGGEPEMLALGLCSSVFISLAGIATGLVIGISISLRLLSITRVGSPTGGSGDDSDGRAGSRPAGVGGGRGAAPRRCRRTRRLRNAGGVGRDMRRVQAQGIRRRRGICVRGTGSFSRRQATGQAMDAR
jgi:hypothetical protein